MDSNHVLIGNDRLPFDILSYLFQLYLDQETILYPLETLLLVCKAWNEAAVTFRSLWGSYKIVTDEGDDEDLKKFWLRRLPVRLRRSGLNTPLHIDFETKPNYRYPAYRSPTTDIGTNIGRLFDILAGEKGHLCARWKSLRIVIGATFGQANIHSPHRFVFLANPMPSLVSLHLVGLQVRSHATFFRDLPSIESIAIHECQLPNLPDMSHARRILLDEIQVCREGVKDRFINAPNVQDLCLSDNQGRTYRLPQKFAALRTLSLLSWPQIQGIESILTPCLETLIIDFLLTSLVEAAILLPALSRVRTLYLVGNKYSPQFGRNNTTPIFKLLRACRNVQTLIINDFVLSLILAAWQGWSHLFEGQEAGSITLFFHRERHNLDVKLSLEDEETYRVLEEAATRHGITLPEEFYIRECLVKARRLSPGLSQGLSASP
ncbi:hypothetical protein FRC14_007222 [Serendipita sp. 396]|nr:hypothetical protein FRC14_007222 [Serendipita sp. 396]KAG8794738.1 hypothetical protein FRC16_010373 [Serendipita sp. 398]KAG8828424.1 hypothetical protein FRC19_006522 [Serendipita sp. 401]KAG8840681.1 hypothetical protein FRC20_005494 [Serendipita sp. 405]KAG9058099.1 hypothetical protein FS842_001680 [Serendipita sp. 407]